MSARSVSFSFLLVLAASAPLKAGEPYLVKDINPRSAPNSSIPFLFGSAGSRIVFEAASDDSSVRQPWGSDGTFQGTEPLLDGCPESCRDRMRPYRQTDRLFFFLQAADGVHDDVWATDGTHAGTFRLTNQPVRPLADLAAVASTPSQIYFLANDSVHGTELWRSDGTPHGTHLITDLFPGPFGPGISEIVTLGERAVFVADDGRGYSVWISDGTPGGTRLLLDPNPRSATQERPAHLRRVGRYVYFVANAGKSGTELWRTDGTSAGTAMVADLAKGAKSLDYVAGGSLGDRLLFVAGTPGRGREVWISNGTKAGTYAVSNFAPADPFARTAVPELDEFAHSDLVSRAIFGADDGSHGQELWVTDGSRAGARLVRDVCPGPCSSEASPSSTHLGNQGFFIGDDGVHGRELWVSDGTAAGTRMLAEVCPGACGVEFSFFGALGEKLAFLSQSPSGMEIWTWSPGAATATRVAAFAPTDYLYLSAAARVVGRRLFVSALTPDAGQELWRSNLTPAGTVLVRDLAPSHFGSSSNPRSAMRLGGRALFFATTDDPGEWLWKTDGTEAGTETIPLPTGGEGGGYFASAQLGPLALFRAGDEHGETTLWRSDGTTPGTFPLAPAELALAAPSAGFPVAAGPRAYFAGSSGDAGLELWATDGSLAGTRQVADLQPGPEGSSPGGFVALGERVLFRATTGVDGEELWVSDGTAAGTRIVKDLTPEAGASTSPIALVVRGSMAFFSTLGTLDRRVVWRTDGTAAGTLPAVDGSILPGVDDLTPVASAGGKLFLFARKDFGVVYVTDGTSGTAQQIQAFGLDDGSPHAWTEAGGRLFFVTGGGRLWVSDGTAAGTRRVAGPAGFIDHADPLLLSFGNRLAFSQLLDGIVSEVWITDGTPAGTRRLAAGSSFDSPLLLDAGGKILFRGGTAQTGTELWAVEP